MTAPGVYTTTSVLSGPAASTDAEAATYYVAGITERGEPSVSTLVRSMNEFRETFGDPIPAGTLDEDLRTFFEEGGGRVAVTRAVGPAATTGDVTLGDSLRVEALSPGAWSSRVSVGVEAGSVAGAFTLAVYLDGAVVERWQDLADAAAAALVLNGSAYVRGTDLGGTGDPAPAAPVALAAGADDRAAVDGAALVAALPTGDTIKAPNGSVVPAGAGVVAVPGQSAATIGAALLAYAKATSRIALLSMPAGTSATDARSAARTLTATASQAGTAEFGGLFWPHLRVPVQGANATRLVGPEGYVAAARARGIISAGGPWRVGAGQLSAARYVAGVEAQADGRAELDALDDARVSVIRPVVGVPQVYGHRSLSPDAANYRLLRERDVVNAVAVACSRAAEQFTFEVVDGYGRLQSRLKAALVGVVDPIAQAGGLYPSDGPGGGDPGYVVDTSAAVNTEAVLARGEVRAFVGIRPSPTAELIQLTIAKAAPTTGL